MFELVLVAPKAAVAGTVAALRASFQELKGSLEDAPSQAPNATDKPSAAGEGVVNVHLGFAPVPPRVSQRRPVLRLEFLRFEPE